MSKPPKSLPPIQVKEPAARRVLEAIKEIVEIGEGVRGSPLDKKLTIRDLRDAGIIEYIQRANFNAATDIAPVTENPILTVPPAPTGFEVAPGIGVIFLTWDAPGFVNHAYTNIYRSTEDNFANADVISQASFTTYMDSAPFQIIDEETGQLQGYYYWITHVSEADVEGPPNDAQGTYGEPSLSAEYLLELLQGQLDENAFVQSLRDALLEIPDIQTDLANEVAARLGLSDQFDASEDNLSVLAEAMLQSIANVGDKVFVLENRVNTTVNGRTIEQVADRVDSIRNHISGEVGERKAEAEAIKSNIVLLETTIDDTNQTVSAQATEIDSLSTAVSLADQKASANETSITQLNVDIDDANGVISSQATQITQLQTDVSTADSKAQSALNSTANLDSQIDDLNGIVSAQGTSLTQLSAEVDALDDDINGAGGTVSRLDTVDAELVTLGNEVSGKASAQSVTDVYAYVDDEVGQVQVTLDTVADSVNGVTSKYTVKVDANGKIAGFGLVSQPNSTEDGLTVIGSLPFDSYITQAAFSVDHFSISSPGSGDLAFSVDSNTGLVAMNGAYIVDASIDNAKITNLNAEKINAGTINVALTLNAATINGGQLDIGNGNFVVDSSGNLTANSATINGHITAQSFTGQVIGTGELVDEACTQVYREDNFHFSGGTTDYDIDTETLRTCATLDVPELSFGNEYYRITLHIQFRNESGSNRRVRVEFGRDNPPPNESTQTGLSGLSTSFFMVNANSTATFTAVGSDNGFNYPDDTIPYRVQVAKSVGEGTGLVTLVASYLEVMIIKK